MCSTVVTTLRNSALLAMVLLAGLPSGCGRDAGAQQLDRTLAQEFSAGLPAVSSLRTPSALTQIQQLGCFPLEASPGAVLDTVSLFEAVLDASDGGRFEWAVYSFDPGPDPLVEAEVVLRNSDPQDQLFIGIANFQSQAWDFKGPFSAESTSLPLDSATAFSGSGQVFIATVAPLGSNFSVFRVRLRHLENDAPVADLQADTTTGDVPLLVNFDASGSTDGDGSIVNYKWDLGGDGVFEQDTGTTATNQLTYSAGGVFSYAVQVTDDDRATSTASVQILASEAGNVPPKPILVADVLEGDGENGFTVNFSSDQSFDSDGSIDLYEWDLDGDGNFELSSSAPDPQSQVYVTPGEFKPQLRVTDNGGLSRKAALTILSHGWVRVPVHTVANGSNALGFSLARIGKFPAFSFRDLDNGKLEYAHSSTQFGALAADWSLTEIADSASSNTSLLEVEKRPAICFKSNTTTLIYTRSNTASGGAPGDWLSTQIMADSSAATVSLALADGKPAVAVVDSALRNLNYAFSSTVTGSMAADWDFFVLDPDIGTSFKSVSLATVEGNPAIAWVSGGQFDPVLRYARSTTAAGSQLSDWQFAELGPAGAVNTDTSIDVLELDGAPTISCHTIGNTPGVGYFRSPDSLGIENPWSSLIIQSGAETGLVSSLAIVAGVPVILFDSRVLPSGLQLATSSSVDGALLTDWQVEPASEAGQVTPTSLHFCDLADISGYPAIASFNDADDEVTYAIRF